MQNSLKKNTILNILRTCSAILFPLITFPYVSRVLQPANIGKVNFAQSYVNYFVLIAGLGISTHAIRECAVAKKDKAKLEKVSSEIFSINLFSAIIAYVVLFISLAIIKDVQKYIYLILIESFVIAATTFGADWLNSAMEDLKYITIRTVLFQVISLVLTLCFVRTSDDYYKYALIGVLSSAGANIINIIYRGKYCRIHLTLHIDWKKHLAPIVYLFVMQLSTTIFNNADITMLGIMQNDYQVGLYSTALKVTRIISQVVQSLSLVIIPRLTVLFKQGDFENANRLLRKVLGFNLTLGLPCVAGTILMTEEIIFFVGGSEYLGAIPVIRVLILCFMFSLVGGSFLGNAILIPMNQEKYYMMICCITAVCNVALNAFLIPRFSSIGAASATALNGFIIMALLFLKVDKRIRIPDLKPIVIGPTVGCILIAICCLLCSVIENVYFRTAISICLSAVVYIIVQLIARNDIVTEFLSDIGRKISQIHMKGRGNHDQL